jgi:hypothetical protein
MGVSCESWRNAVRFWRSNLARELPATAATRTLPQSQQTHIASRHPLSFDGRHGIDVDLAP